MTKPKLPDWATARAMATALDGSRHELDGVELAILSLSRLADENAAGGAPPPDAVDAVVDIIHAIGEGLTALPTSEICRAMGRLFELRMINGWPPSIENL